MSKTIQRRTVMRGGFMIVTSTAVALRGPVVPDATALAPLIGCRPRSYQVGRFQPELLRVEARLLGRQGQHCPWGASQTNVRANRVAVAAAGPKTGGCQAEAAQ